MEGAYPGNEYRWKDTVGPVIDRIPQVNLWAAELEDKGYCQSYQIGFYEYFLLCEDLGIEPLPIVWGRHQLPVPLQGDAENRQPGIYGKSSAERAGSD